VTSILGGGSRSPGGVGKAGPATGTMLFRGREPFHDKEPNIKFSTSLKT